MKRVELILDKSGRARKAGLVLLLAVSLLGVGCAAQSGPGNAGQGGAPPSRIEYDRGEPGMNPNDGATRNQHVMKGMKKYGTQFNKEAEVGYKIV